MNLIRRPSAERGLFDLRREMDRLFEGFFENGSETTQWVPPVDVTETAERVTVKTELPGLDPKDVEISVSDDTLTIRGEKKSEKEEKGETWHRTERHYGSFVRSVVLPSHIDAEHVNAEAKDGVLTITLPKTEKSKAKRITVKVK